MNQPTVFLGMPDHMGIYRSIQANLEHHGFNVIHLVADSHTFRYPSLAARLQTKFRQLVLRDKQAKQKLQAAVFYQNLLSTLDAAGGVDYALFIRGDLYTPEMLADIRRRTRGIMANYQWDGMNRYPDIWQTVANFDRFYVFDPADLQSGSNFLPLTNFYFDHPAPPAGEAQTDFYFIGSHLPERSSVIAEFGNQALAHGWTLDFNIICAAKEAQACRTRYPNNIKISTQTADYAENLQHTARAKVLVDFKTPVHNGLSFRAFEALGYRKKLITTNAEAAKYDFYHPNNIFIWDGTTFNGIDDFLKRPYHEISTEIRQKYSFGNWIRYVLDIPPYQPVTLPEA
ncbi:hypothetical protein [Neisseria musculi]|uniref:Uncharacterized protein n=1 Tax=Neisseria musculi TaxID=1815583 RepID=A0A7H1MCX1_9NEIS|nr:hypothetical protein [Neisseria musculi]QNT59486.1 hypothetical protein H7A79_2496 [Neisseria musculi]